MFSLPAQLTATDIERMLAKVPFFKGAFSADTIPTFSPKSLNAFIVNTDVSSKPGDHWVAFVIDEQDNCIYFDSFGIQIICLSMLEALDRMAIPYYKYNCKEIQPLHSENCGWYAIAYIISFCFKIPYDDFLDLFSESDKRNNDIICYEFISKFINLL